MLSPSDFHDLVSGRHTGPLASSLRAVLRVAEVPYTAVVAWRNRRFDRVEASSVGVDVPVISVGNLTLGGTGKTPLVEWIVRWLRERNLRVAIVSRGYGAEEGKRNDEAIQLEQSLPDVPHLQNRDRVEAAQTAIDELDMQCIVLDDGFQHRRLRRDLDIVLLDACEPFGHDHVFPRGTLREPLSGIRRAQVVILSRADLIDASQREAIRQRVTQLHPQALWLEACHQPRSFLTSGGAEQPIVSLRGQRVAAFCGIGNPQGFRHTLDSIGASVEAFREFPDHHLYTRDDIESLTRWADEASVAAVLCTHKDLVKIGVDRLGTHSLWALTIGLTFTVGEELLEACLQQATSRITED